MPAITAPAKVLVSGANGYIAVWVVQDLLQQGYSVRGTVRSEGKASHLRKLFASYGDKFEVVIVDDITAPGAFDAAVKGVDAIEHTASPFHFNVDDPNELVVPAVKGTTGILESALKHAGPQLKRIVVLSSTASVGNPSEIAVLDEKDWNEENIIDIREKGRAANPVDMYRASKSLAEKAAWEFVSTHKSEITWDLVTLCPPFVFGPVIHETSSSPEQLNTSVKIFYLSVIKSGVPSESLADSIGSWVDVRDIAKAHVKAIEVPAAGGERFVISSGNFTWQDWLDAANEAAVSGFTIPKGTPGAGTGVKHKMVYISTKSINILGMQYRNKVTTAKDSLENFKELGFTA